MAETKIAIGGMSCQHCVMAVKKALGGVPGILETDVQVGSASVKFDDSKVKKEDIENSIEKAGYKVVRQ
ncbi:MAG: Copper chaperone CopZ [Syntrophorhabdus sp. PtaB.Bin006]|nr:MAG: Copper chaperone CopZ [Syntrophorhabdus sp. PtaB.Bin006]